MTHTNAPHILRVMSVCSACMEMCEPVEPLTTSAQVDLWPVCLNNSQATDLHHSSNLTMYV